MKETFKKEQQDNVAHILVSQSFLPGGGGVEVSMNQIAHAIDSKMNQYVEIICLAKGNHQDVKIFDEEYAFPVYRSKFRMPMFVIDKFKNFNSIVSGDSPLNVVGKFSMVIVFLSSVALLLNNIFFRIRANSRKLVIITCFSQSSLFVVVILRKLFFFNRRIKIVFYNGFVYKKSGWSIVDLVLQKILLNVDRFICVSNAAGVSLVSSFSVPQKDILTFRYWMDENRNLPKIVNKKKQEHAQVHILFVGRIVPEKGILDIIRLAKYIHNKKLDKKYRITLIGDSDHPIVTKLHEANEKYHCLTYLGRINKPALWKYYQDSDIFLMLSRWEEGAGNVIIEAGYFGIPIIATNKGGIPELLQLFPYHAIVDSVEPRVILDEIDNLWKEMNATSLDKAQKSIKDVVNSEFSKKNFRVFESMFKELIDEL